MRGFRWAWALSLWVVAFSLQAQPLSVEVLSAVARDQHIADAEVLLHVDAEPRAMGSSDARGRVVLNTDVADDRSTVLTIKRHGYADLESRCPCDGMTYAMSPLMANPEGLRVVLTWSATPQDLDAHLIFPGNTVYFENRQGADAQLDVEASNGYGPETITLEQKHSGQSYVYAVHDFTHGNVMRSHQLSRSQARVMVYNGHSLLRSYSVPQNRIGNLWTVFRITGNGELQDINSLTQATVEAAQALSEMSALLDDKVAVASVAVNADTQDDAQTLNAKGEAADQAGDATRAINFYRMAIELDDAYVQAYSNLGLAHRKAGSMSESIEASRRAIELASGKSAATVRAGAYYNIGRVYEDAGQFPGALRHYQLARQQKANPVYDKAIERVRNR